VIHYPINVLEGEGPELKEEYDVGNTYPVFILTNSDGEIITRWTGYSTAGYFANKLKGSMKDLRTIKQRRADFEADPTFREAISLGNFYSEIGEHLEAAGLFQRAEKLNTSGKINLKYDIFREYANAVWKDMAPFDTVYAPADRVIQSGQNDLIIKMSKIMSRLSRKFENTDSLQKYLDVGIDAATKSRDAKAAESRYLLVAEHALQIAHDTAKAIEIKELSMGHGWESSPDKFYEYARWCLERRINLGQAEYFARMAVTACPAGEQKAMVLNVLAEIYDARGNYQGAVEATQMAIQNHPENPFYQTQLEKFQEELDNQQK
jgi:tetratricopeptide (TPR) repeat protein